MREESKKLKIGEMLLSKNIISTEQLEYAINLNSELKLGELMVELGFVEEEVVCQVLSEQLGYQKIDLIGIEIQEELLKLIPGNILRKHLILPVGYVKNSINEIYLAMSDPMDISAIDDVVMITNYHVVPLIATRNELLLTLDRFFGKEETLSVAEKFVKEREKTRKVLEEEIKENELQDSPIVYLVKTILEQAGRQNASDVHIEPLRERIRIRFRIDGVLYEKMTYEPEILPAIITRIKIISGMDISEKRLPQDGRLTIDIDKIEYDIRVSTMPTVYGEKCVMRLARKKALTRHKKELGFSSSEMKRFDEILNSPNGIILVTGPTGSGKSTTLYTALSELNRDEVNIITVEDPVEANIDGINQVQVNTKAGLTFSSTLRSILRQDPDIIMIGEIRDGDTATIAVQASITGHLVVSTLHTNSTASSIVRLEDMGIERYLIADSVVGIVAQRLVRKLCKNCKQEIMLNDAEKELLELDLEKQYRIFEPCGCNKCENTGYSGRIGVYEIMKVTPELKKLISQNNSSDEIMQQALNEGMQTLKMSCKRLILKGVTSVSEMNKIIYESS